MIKVTTRYLASHFIPPFVLGLIFFIAFLNTFYMFRIIKLIVNKGVDALTVLGMVTNLSFSFIPLATPLAAFFATIFTLNKLSEDSEIIAMRSFGLTKFKIYLPFLTLSFLIAFTVNSLYSVLIPKANGAFKNTVLRLTSAGMLSSIKSGQFFTDIPNATLFAEEVINDGNNFKSVFIHLKDRNEQGQRMIFAKNGSLIKIYADQWHPPSLRLHLTDGNIVNVDQSGKQTSKILFQEYDFPVFNADFASALLDKDSMKTNDELHEVVKVRKESYQKALSSNLEPDKLKEIGKMYYKSAVELYSRYAVASQIMLFIFLAFSLGIKAGRGGGGHGTAKAIAALLSYYAVYFFLISLAQKGKMDAMVANFTPSLLGLVVAYYFYKKLDWVG